MREREDQKYTLKHVHKLTQKKTSILYMTKTFYCSVHKKERKKNLYNCSWDGDACMQRPREPMLPAQRLRPTAAATDVLFGELSPPIQIVWLPDTLSFAFLLVMA